MLVRYRVRAERDLEAITDYTVQTWGQEQAQRYLDALTAGIEMLASNPGIGRACDEVSTGLRSMPCQKHVIFYREEPTGLLISRVLHQQQLPSRHAFNDTEGDV